MVLQPASLDELTATLTQVSMRGEKVSKIDLTALSRVLEHAPEDMTVTVEAGITLAALQARLGERGQWLPIDPPHPARASIGAILAKNASGPRRLGFGTVRDYLIGLRVALADGTIIKSGGKVVKNVAGYDLAKLFIGSLGTLGVIVEATFKLRPLPEQEVFVQRALNNTSEAGAVLETIAESSLVPAVFDLHNLDQPPALTLVLGFAGAREDVEWQLHHARELGVHQPATLGHEQRFWSETGASLIQTRSVLPSNLTTTLSELSGALFVARAGDGLIHYHGAPPPPRADLPRHLFERVKQAFDPKRVFPEISP